MGKTYLLLVLPLWAVAPGCGLVENATRNVVLDPIHFPQHLNEWTACHRNDKLADAAWNYIRQINPEVEEPIHYARGFKQGFANYLEAGGTGAPPPIPPRQYWKTCYQTPRGHKAVEEWYEGFRHGAAMAQDSGFRQWITVPSSLAYPPTFDEPAESPTPNVSALRPLAGSALADTKKYRLGPPKKPEPSASVASRQQAPATGDQRVVPAALSVRPENLVPPRNAQDKDARQVPPTDGAPPDRLPVVTIKGANKDARQVPPTDSAPPDRLPVVIIKGANKDARQVPPTDGDPPDRLPVAIIKGANAAPYEATAGPLRAGTAAVGKETN